MYSPKANTNGRIQIGIYILVQYYECLYYIITNIHIYNKECSRVKSHLVLIPTIILKHEF